VEGGFEEVHGDVAGRDVEDGRVAGFEDAEGADGFDEEDAAVEDADVAVAGLEAGRARVVPYGFVGRIVWRRQRRNLSEGTREKMSAPTRVGWK
jgi:hypothetical protein